MITGLESDNVKLLWIAATNPAVSMPDLERTKKALLKLPFTIYQDAYYPTETVLMLTFCYLRHNGVKKREL
jgi:ferredoxin-nitrate reductase